jgi:pyruvate dehydrogenase E2 component (dihydrolipoamide acetyltransferase)
MAEVTMPRLSDSMEEGTILKWLKSDGDEVQRGDELVEIETDKANMTYEADQDGVLEIVAKEGDTLPVGGTIARIGEGSAEGPGARAPQDEAPDEERAGAEQGADDEPGAEEPAAAEQPAAEEADDDQPDQADRPAPEEQAGPQTSDNGDAGERIKASPVARRMARELGIDLAQVKGSGPGGRIVKSDVRPAQHEPEEEPADTAPAPTPAPAASRADTGTAKGEAEVHELTRLQQTVARRMAESKATAPEFVLNVEVDMSAAVEFRLQLKAAAGRTGSAPSFNDFVIKASALALREFPRANGAYRDGRFELYSRVNVGMAVAGQDALVVPTVFDADRKSLGQIARDSRALAERVRAGEITPPELSGGTFTVSNLGMYGIRRIVPVINPPQAAILGVGSLEPRAVVRDGEIVVRQTMDLTLICDHRILYGADAAEFLVRIRERLEQPLKLAL